eukprot:324457-Amorphochlora_amoeboformis.AAC.1
MAALASPAKGVEFDVHTVLTSSLPALSAEPDATTFLVTHWHPLHDVTYMITNECKYLTYSYCIVPPRWEVITSKQEGKGYRVWELFKDFRGEGLPSPPSASMLVAFKKKHSKKVIHWREGTAVDVGLVGQQDGVQRKSIFLALSFGGDRGDYFRYLDKKIHPESEN